MKKRVLSILLTMVILLSVFTPVGFAADEIPTLTEHEAAYLALIDYDNAERMAVDLTEGIGARYTNTYRRDLTVDYIMNEFKEAGYEPYIHAFNTPTTYVNGTITVDGEKFVLYGPDYNTDSAFQTAGNTTITGVTTISWPDATVDLTVPADTDYGKKVVFVTMDGTSAPTSRPNTMVLYYNAVLALQNANAGAVIFQYYAPREDGNTSYARIGNTPGTGNTKITIMVGTVLYHEMNAVVSAVNDATTVKLTMQATNDGKNVVAFKPSASGSEKTVYVTSHLDSMISTPGMNDNASGVIMTIEMARVFRDIPFEYNIAFICFDAEETGLRGAREFCADMTDSERENFVANYNMDMIATVQEDCIHMFLNISDTRLDTLEEDLTATDRLMDVPEAVEIAKEYDIFNHSYLAAQKTGFDMNYFNICYDTTTDHYAFVAEAAKFADGRYDNMRNAVEYDWRRNEKGTSFETLYHKTGDTFEVNYSRERNQGISEIVALAIYHSAKADVTYPLTSDSSTGGGSSSSNCNSGVGMALALLLIGAGIPAITGKRGKK